MKNIGRLSALALAVISLSACATITRGTKQTVEFKSTPDGADVATTVGYSCVTPCKTKLKRKDGFEATFSKAGYESTTVKVESKLAGGGAAAGAGNLILGGLIGGIVDGTNGSMNNLTPSPVEATLVPIGAVAKAEEAAPIAPAAEEVEPVTEAAPAEEPAATL